MFRALGFSRSAADPDLANKHSSSSVSLNLLDDAIALEQGLKAMDYLMDDHMNETDELLKNENSAFCKLAKGVISFIEAILGFEPDVIKLACDTLYEAEQAAYKERQKAIKNNKISSSRFPPGLEYSVAYAEAQLLSAITLFLSESVIDNAKALYRLRKAYQTFDQVSKQLNSSSLQETLSSSISASTPNLLNITKGSLSKQASSASLRGKGTTVDDGILTLESLKIPEVAARAKKFHRARLERNKELTGDDKSHHLALVEKALADLTLGNNGTKKAGQETVDEYIVSAINACYGILQLVISIIPPGIGRVLSIVGFNGDKDEALTMLWKATAHTNIHGCIALLALLQFYDGPTQVSDIVLPRTKSESSTWTETEGEPMIPTNFDDIDETKRCLKAALAKASKHYSRGALWQLQEGRMKASEGKLKEAVEIMDDTSRGPINLRQVEGLMLFDKTMFILALHGYETAAPNYLRLIDLNTWSHMLYTYLSGVCQVEIYRANKKSNPEKAAEAKKKALKCFDDAPSYFHSKKKILSKPMPFDTFVLRKLKLWKEIADKNNVDLVDAIGTSPSHEIIYFWNGFGRMPESELENALKILGHTGEADTDFSSSEGEPVIKEVEDESLVRYLLQAIALRNLKRVDEGYELLKTKVLPKVYRETPEKGHYKSGIPKVLFTKNCREPWLAPSAIYEMAVFEWTIHGTSKVDLVRDYLEMANSWSDDYELSTRVGLKIKSALSRLEDIDEL
ncbi:hypothetical protein D0Z00_000928 [Geotrichum galactomycetum]|uniref:Uncharacterized protein n=1 Tax=Geotrichum galactomycetum TaxID=27317 RepID=A0ACB6V898_9ASCO|nr:hypothetical protein D0Z00_000928 [Geotrichum candidum]